MNLLLLQPDQRIDDNRYIIRGRQQQHLVKIHQVTVGQSLNAGLLDDRCGRATVLEINNDSIVVDLALDSEPPASLPLTLCIALPRPQMLHRIIQTTATMGVKELIFFQSAKVEKSYWQTPQLNDDKITENIILGLEQGCDTTLPEINFEKRFRPFAEDRLPELCKNRRALIAHPYGGAAATEKNDNTLLMIGPEGGFTSFEVEAAENAGCSAIHLGKRILRVETAVTVLLSRLFPIT